MNHPQESPERLSSVPEQDPSKAMDSKKEVEQSNDNKIDQDYPGYPHYPAKEDAMAQQTDGHRVDADVEKLPADNATGVSQRYLAGQDREQAKDAMIPGPATQDDLDYNPANRSNPNEERGVPQNVSNEDLSSGKELPGTDLDAAAQR